MKGTFFSADFIEDQNGDLRLLELNTDTATYDSNLQFVDFDPFVNMLVSSNITTLQTIHKSFHTNIVAELSARVNALAPSITVESIIEEEATIYPTSVEDAADKFILRFAYDESAVFDSTYTKNKLNPLKLFTDGGENTKVVEYYVSSSTDGVVDILPTDFNSSNAPDVVVKDLNVTVNNPLSFYKLGNSSDTPENRYSNFKQAFDSNNLIIKYYDNPGDSKVKSLRSLNIIYGSNLDVINIGNFVGEALFEKPSSLTIDDSVINNKIDIKHYYEFATSFPKFTTVNNWGGIFEEEEILKVDGTPVLISAATVGDTFKSYYINGAPDTDVPSEFLAWTHPGSELPSGSYETGSVLINNIDQPIVYGLVFHFTMEDGSTFRASGGSHLLVYDVEQDLLRYEDVQNIDASKHRLINLTGGTSNITSIVMEVLDGEYSSHILDMESSDTFFLSNGDLSVKVVTHNCFPAGTKITLADGSQKNIENLTVNDKLLTWNEHTGELAEGSIGNIVKKSENLLIHLATTEGEIKSTPFHKFYVKDKRWTSAQDIVKGDILINKDNQEVVVLDRNDILGEVEVYHILDVKDNHTYFAENLLVHNYKSFCFVAGTEITLANGDVKNIEDINSGESVLTFNLNDSITEEGIVGEIKSHEVDSVIRLTFDNEIITLTTAEHPFFVEGKGWVKAKDLQSLDVCKKADNSEALVSTVEVLEEKHTVYNLINVGSNHNFFANNILVHNKL